MLPHFLDTHYGTPRYTRVLRFPFTARLVLRFYAPPPLPAGTRLLLPHARLPGLYCPARIHAVHLPITPPPFGYGYIYPRHTLRDYTLHTRLDPRYTHLTVLLPDHFTRTPHTPLPYRAVYRTHAHAFTVADLHTLLLGYTVAGLRFGLDMPLFTTVGPRLLRWVYARSYPHGLRNHANTHLIWLYVTLPHYYGLAFTTCRTPRYHTDSYYITPGGSPYGLLLPLTLHTARPMTATAPLQTFLHCIEFTPPSHGSAHHAHTYSCVTRSCGYAFTVGLLDAHGYVYMRFTLYPHTVVGAHTLFPGHCPTHITDLIGVPIHTQLLPHLQPTP